MELSLLEQLETYNRSDYYPFHMPGHKRNPAIDAIPVGIDITEIEGFDNLHHAQTILLKAQQRAARLYGAEESFFLVNGSTAGILSAISASVSPKGRILMSRNSHKAAYHAAFLRDLDVVYMYPQIVEKYGICGGIEPKQLESILKHNSHIQAVLITSPTYEGMVSNIKEIADIIHRNHILLIVDEAHGAHLGLADNAFPKGALAGNADLVIQSLHKTLPSLTQTAILHVQGERVDRQRLKKYLQIYQSSSPSYVFMAGMDHCIRLIEQEGKQLFRAYQTRLEYFYEAVADLQHLHVLCPNEVKGSASIFDMDASKICIFTKNTTISGTWLYKRLLQQYHLQMEMAAGDYVLAMTSIMDTDEGFMRLNTALHEIDREIYTIEQEKPLLLNTPIAKVSMTAAKAEEQEREVIALEEAEGRISLEYRYLYPPGVPLLVPGERISREVLTILQYYESNQLNVQGQEVSIEKIGVVKEN